MNLATRIFARTAVVALVAVSAAFFAGCKDKEAVKKEEAAKELKAAKDALKEKKFEDAVKSLQSASDKDESEATLLLAFCYGEGKGVEKDEDKAKDLVKKAADAGNVKAKFLSLMEELDHSEKEPDEAAKKQLKDLNAELKKLAEAGDADAMALYALSLGATLDSLEDLAKVMEEAQKWADKAKENGSFFVSIVDDDDED